MPVKAVINFPLCVISGLTAAIGLLLAVSQAVSQDTPAFLLFLAVGVLFCAIAWYYGGRLEFSQSGIALVRPGFPTRFVSWGELEEVGICGTRVFSARNAKKKGTQYFYFSRSRMDPQQRFEMLLRWPPRAVLFCKFSPQLVPVICSYWQKDLILENTNPDVDHHMEEFYSSLNRQDERRSI